MTWGVVNLCLERLTMVTLATEVRGVKEGGRYGRRVAIGQPFSGGKRKSGNRVWVVVVQCDCGRVDATEISTLVGSTKCRTCAGREVNTIHGSCIATKPRQDRLYDIWCNMKGRCGNPGNSNYANYGGRGIRVCDEWEFDYPAFRDWALANSYNDSLTIDRIDNDGNYEPGNCQWLTRSENSKKQFLDKAKAR